MDSTSKMILFTIITICVYLLLKNILDLIEKSIDNDFALEREAKKEIYNKSNGNNITTAELTQEDKKNIVEESNELINKLDNTIEHNIFGINVDDVENSNEV